MLTSNYDGDFDIDASDAIFGACVPPPVGNCRCLALDFDEDGDIDLVDVTAFFDLMTGPFSDCVACPHGGDGGGDGGGAAEEEASFPAGCELAHWFITQTPAEYVAPFLESLEGKLEQHTATD